MTRSNQEYANKKISHIMEDEHNQKKVGFSFYTEKDTRYLLSSTL